MIIKASATLRQNYNDIVSLCKETKEPVFLTKNGYGAMVVLSLQEYSSLTDNIERKLDEADLEAKNSSIRLSHKEVFDSINEAIDAK